MNVNPVTRRLLDVMLRKHSNLCVAIDKTESSQVLELVKKVRNIRKYLFFLHVLIGLSGIGRFISAISYTLAKKLGNFIEIWLVRYKL